MPKTLRLAAVAALPLLAAACSGGGDGGPDPVLPTECTFTNPVAVGADPWVVQHAGAYYLVQSRDRGIFVSRSTRLTEVSSNPVRVWSAPESGWNRDHVWAPELHRIGDRWYIYYAAGRAGPPFIHQRSGVLESVSDDPQGAYVDRGLLGTGEDPNALDATRWAIDVSVTRIGGQLYAVWSGWENDATVDRTPQHLYIAPMSNPWTISGRRVRLSSPTEAWERGTELNLQEGPQFLQRGASTFVIYSTRESWLPDYRLGQLRLRDGADPLDPASWTKSGPVFQATGEVFGVGHASFTRSPDGTEDWIVYHAKTSTSPGWDRVIRMQKFAWNADGSPSFGAPASASARLPAPSGECR